jgi:hypothetical protein
VGGDDAGAGVHERLHLLAGHADVITRVHTVDAK